MSPFLKSIISSKQLPAVNRCQKIVEKVKARREVFAVVHAKIQALIDVRDAAMQKLIEKPLAEDFDSAIDIIAKGNAAIELRARVCEREDISIRQLEQDPSAIADLEEGIREMIDEIDSIAKRMQDSEKKAARDAGVEYAGASPTLKSLTDVIKLDYVNALSNIESIADHDPSTLFRQFIQLLTP